MTRREWTCAHCDVHIVTYTATNGPPWHSCPKRMGRMITLDPHSTDQLSLELPEVAQR